MMKKAMTADMYSLDTLGKILFKNINGKAKEFPNAHEIPTNPANPGSGNVGLFNKTGAS